MRRTNKELLLKIVLSYKQGNSMKAVGLLFSVNTVTVFNILKRYNIETRTKGGIQALPLLDIVKLYLNGASDSILLKNIKSVDVLLIMY